MGHLLENYVRTFFLLIEDSREELKKAKEEKKLQGLKNFYSGFLSPFSIESDFIGFKFKKRSLIDILNEISSFLDVKRKDRMIWYLSRVKAYLILEALKEEELSKEAKLALETKLSKLPTMDQANLYHVSMGEYDHTIKHFLSLPIDKIQSFEWNPQYSYNEIIQTFQKFEKEWKEKQSEYIPKSPDDNILIDFGNGNAWVYVDKTYCRLEAAAMGHCGNEGDPKPNDRILSFRTTEVDANGKEFWHPQMTFILDIKTGELGETKGRLNGKPGKKYYPYILELLKNPKIKGIKGGGYKPENNFSFNDLSEEQKEELFGARTDIPRSAIKTQINNKIIYRNPMLGYHREDGPAIDDLKGNTEWWLNGKRHREGDLPAIEYSDGTKEWFIHGKRHREGDLPAVEEGKDGNKFYYINGELHREDGPAIELFDGAKEWYIHDKKIKSANRKGDTSFWDGSTVYKIEYGPNSKSSLTGAIGAIEWFDNLHHLHREDGPAVEHYDGTKEWWTHGRRPESRPSIEEPDGTKKWYKNRFPYMTEFNDGGKTWHNNVSGWGSYHREDGPAVEDPNGDKEWYINGKRHREDGPAIEGADGTRKWYLNGFKYSEEEWRKKVGK